MSCRHTKISAVLLDSQLRWLQNGTQNTKNPRNEATNRRFRGCEGYEKENRVQTVRDEFGGKIGLEKIEFEWKSNAQRQVFLQNDAENRENHEEHRARLQLIGRQTVRVFRILPLRTAVIVYSRIWTHSARARCKTAKTKAKRSESPPFP